MRAGVVVACVVAGAGSLAVALLLPSSPPAAEPERTVERPPPATVSIEDAEARLVALEASLDRRKSENGEIVSALDAVSAAYRSLGPTDPPRAAAFRSGAEKRFLEAFTLQRLKPKAMNNEREEVNVRAAQALAATGNRELSKRIRAEIRNKLMKSKYQVSNGLWEAAFGSLGTLGDPETLDWYGDDFTHTKNSPSEVVDQLVAAHRSIPLFDLREVRPRQRLDLAKLMITPYTSVESAAEQSQRDPKKLARKVFWDRVGPDAIRAARFLAGDPVGPDGQPIDTMRGLQMWFREHDDPRKAPWKTAP